MTLDEARDHIGDGVVYVHAGGREDGTITSVNDAYVFVRYLGRNGSAATRAEDLTLLVPVPIMADIVGVPTCSLCGRERTLTGMDAYDYNPIQAITGQPFGWYSGDDGEVCPEDMERTVRGHLS